MSKQIILLFNEKIEKGELELEVKLQDSMSEFEEQIQDWFECINSLELVKTLRRVGLANPKPYVKVIVSEEKLKVACGFAEKDKLACTLYNTECDIRAIKVNYPDFFNGGFFDEKVLLNIFKDQATPKKDEVQQEDSYLIVEFFFDK